MQPIIPMNILSYGVFFIVFSNAFVGVTTEVQYSRPATFRASVNFKIWRAFSDATGHYGSWRSSAWCDCGRLVKNIASNSRSDRRVLKRLDRRIATSSLN